MNNLIKTLAFMAMSLLMWSCSHRPAVVIAYPSDASNRVEFAAGHLKEALEKGGYEVLD